jgi:hypothetical protein
VEAQRLGYAMRAEITALLKDWNRDPACAPSS